MYPTLQQFIQNYHDLCFYPYAITNFLSLLTNAEILTLEQLIKYFDINRAPRSPCFFDFERMK